MSKNFLFPKLLPMSATGRKGQERKFYSYHQGRIHIRVRRRSKAQNIKTLKVFDSTPKLFPGDANFIVFLQTEENASSRLWLCDFNNSLDLEF